MSRIICGSQFQAQVRPRTKFALIKASHLFDTIAIEFLLFYLYDDTSEALHATVYGCAFHIGAFEPGAVPGSIEDMKGHMGKRLVVALWLGSSAVTSINKWLLSLTNQLDVLKDAEECAVLGDEYLVRALKKPARRRKSSE